MGRREETNLSLPADVKYAHVLGSALTAMFEEESAEAYNIQLAVHELFTNIVEHGYGHDASQLVACHLTWEPDDGAFTAVLQDTAAPFSPRQTGWDRAESYWETAVTPQGHRYTLKDVPEPDLLQVRGRGLFLIRQLMSHIVCQASAKGNEWTLST
ncbi:MAG: ATP-binding protein [Chloroflexota bacterium]